MRTKSKMAVVVGVVAMAGAGVGVAAVGASSSDDQEPAITGAELQRASDAALAETGGGTVSDTEVGDEDSHYEVEVTLDDGSQVDVQLDRRFAVVDTMTDNESPDDAGS